MLTLPHPIRPRLNVDQLFTADVRPLRPKPLGEWVLGISCAWEVSILPQFPRGHSKTLALLFLMVHGLFTALPRVHAVPRSTFPRSRPVGYTTALERGLTPSQGG